MSSQNVFVSYFNIQLKNEVYEADFQTKIFNKNKISNPIISAICVCVLILILVETILAANTDQGKEDMESIIVTLVRTGLSSVSMVTIIIFQVFFRSNQFMQVVVTNINYFTFSFNIYFLRKIYFHFFNEDTQLINLSIYINFLIQYAWLFFGLIDFKGTFITNILLIISTTVLNSAIPQWWSNEVYNTILSHILRLTLITYSYFSMRNARYVLYYSTSLKNINDWYKNVLDNINSGFLKVTNGRIVFGNRFEIEWLRKRGLITESDMLKDNIQEVLGEKSLQILDNIISNTTLIDQFDHDKDTASTEDKKDVRLAQSSCCLNELTNGSLLEKIKRCLSFDDQKGRFTFLGNGTFMHSLPEYIYIYELYARKYTGESGENIELILKDITRNQIIKKKNEEIQMKSAILSKIVHEFKNPMLCLSEMVEEESCKACHKTSENCKMIKSLISYLLILVKDLDYFTEMQKTNNSIATNQINIVRISLSEILSFVQMISRYLLKKFKKDKVLSFKVITTDVPKEIDTDEIKLKQILINLISNAIKFTNTGSVLLSVTREDDDYIKFSVNDTGEGIPLEAQSCLFKSCGFQRKMTRSNSYGAGLGLIITKDMAKNLGKPIEFSSIPGKGSSFWFSIKTIEEEHSLSTICVDNQQLEMDKLIMPRSDRSHMRKAKTYNILIVDDEELLRKSTKRILTDFAKKRNIPINIIEASDGLEVLWDIYKNYDQNGHKVNIDIIITDENMVVYNGQTTAKKLKKIEQKLQIKHIKYYLASANTIPLNATDQVDGFLHKPLLSTDLSQIFNAFSL